MIMKRFFTIIPVMILAIALQAQQPNIYAYGLKAELVVGTQYKFTYSLNANAVSGSINIISDGGKTVSLPAPGESVLTKGTHEVTIDLNEFVSGNYTWSVTATGAATGTEPVSVAIDAPLTLAAPRGLAIDNDFESPYFGRIYATSSGTGQKGVYVLDAAFSNPSSVYTTGWSDSPASPLRLTVGPDHLVYITDWSDNPTSGVYVWDPAIPTNNAVPVFGGTVDASGIAKEGETVIHGSVSHCYVEGAGANRKLYTFDEDITVSGVDNVKCLLRYDIGNLSQAWTANPSAVIFPNTAKYVQNANAMIFPDKNGGWWISQDRAADAASIPALIHVNAAGAVDYNSSGALGGRTRGALAINAEQNLLVTVGTNYIRVWDVAWNGSYAPSLTQKYQITTTFGDPVYNVAMDVAGNIFAAGNAKAMAAWALPKAENTFTTPAAAAYKLTIINSTDVRTINQDDLVSIETTDNKLTLKTSGVSLTAYTLYGLDGKVLCSEKVDNLNVVEIPIANLGSGTYLLQAKTTEGIATKKFIKN